MDEQELDKRIQRADIAWQKSQADEDFEYLELLFDLKQAQAMIRTMEKKYGVTLKI